MTIDVILLIEPSSKFSHLYIRAGKIVAAVSLSIKFVVNVTGRAEDDAKTCLLNGDCTIACDLNATLPIAAALHVDKGSVLHGLLHSITIEQLYVLFVLMKAYFLRNQRQHKKFVPYSEHHDRILQAAD